MSSASFSSARYLARRISAYFNYVEGKFHPQKDGNENNTGLKNKMLNNEHEPATITGLALFLGFSSLKAFEEYEEGGKYADALKRGRLRIEATYEKKLHQQPSPGVIFALKSLGWDEKRDCKTASNDELKTLKIEIVKTGPQPVSSEAEVKL